MACYLFGTKSLFKSVLVYCQRNPYDTLQWIYNQNALINSKNAIWKWCVLNVDNNIQATMC